MYNPECTYLDNQPQPRKTKNNAIQKQNYRQYDGGRILCP